MREDFDYDKHLQRRWIGHRQAKWLGRIAGAVFITVGALGIESTVDQQVHHQIHESGANISYGIFSAAIGIGIGLEAYSERLRRQEALLKSDFEARQPHNN